MNNRKGMGAARVDGGRCGLCANGSVHCSEHCPLPRTGANQARGFAERRLIPERRSRSPAPTVFRESARDRADREAAALEERRRREGRRQQRQDIRHSLIGQWRKHVDFGSRPLPTVGEAHVGLLPGVTWADALRSDQLRELLAGEKWRNEREHDSVHITCVLEWAEKELSKQASCLLGGLEIGRHIMGFSGRGL